MREFNLLDSLGYVFIIFFCSFFKDFLRSVSFLSFIFQTRPVTEISKIEYKKSKPKEQPITSKISKGIKVRCLYSAIQQWVRYIVFPTGYPPLHVYPSALLPVNPSVVTYFRP